MVINTSSKDSSHFLMHLRNLSKVATEGWWR